MNKLNANQILDIVQKNYSIPNFAHCEWGELDKSIEIIYSEDEEEELTDIKLAKSKYEDHPGYKDKDQRGEEFQRLQKEYYESGSEYEIGHKAILRILGLGEVVEVEQYGGSDKGSTWYSVKYFKDHDVYIRTNGYYQSYNGTEFDQGYGYEVTPQEKTITVYEPATDEVNIN